MMGTGPFALPTFQQLVDSPHSVVALVTQPDRRGRGHHRHVNPLAELARERGIEVLQPENVNEEEVVARLRSLEADIAVVAAYGQILRPSVLAAPRLGAINLHGSLLPRHRGAAPVQYAILRGDTETGVTIFQIEPRLDAGPVLSMVKTPIDPRETSGELMMRLADLAAPLALETLDGLEQGTLTPEIQDGTQVTKAPQIRKADGIVDWSHPAEEISRMIRAWQPWPLAVSHISTDGRPEVRVILLEATAQAALSEAPVDGDSSAAPATDAVTADAPADFHCGQVVRVGTDRLVVQTGEGVLAITRVRPEGRREMSVSDWLRGYPVAVGDTFGPSTAAKD
ncbi:MAG: methionyl-tRNA formyltransferase [Planctomycetaceae bacterium]|nr:methionyl-tRNA formyltransferase [Planctomycetaceae bacterium]